MESGEVNDTAGWPLGGTRTGHWVRCRCSGLVVPRSAMRRKRQTRWWSVCRVGERGAGPGPRQALGQSGGGGER